MIIKTHRDGFIHPVASEITPARVYEGRRDMIKLMATGVA
ncbi:MAG TPA: protein-methionine-sulfoxide reductase catalytic subunit MsrP, partial [Burkholderiaceae bacterium]|nr:protein-methionine-sulfoxide reductase catalytic subunit MsrP [Burkholderiaceae bacterium]